MNYELHVVEWGFSWVIKRHSFDRSKLLVPRQQHSTIT